MPIRTTSIVVAFFLLSIAWCSCLCGEPPPEGRYIGITAQGLLIEFTVSHGKVVSLFITWNCEGYQEPVHFLNPCSITSDSFGCGLAPTCIPWRSTTWVEGYFDGGTASGTFDATYQPNSWSECCTLSAIPWSASIKGLPAATLYDQTDNLSASAKPAQDFEPSYDDFDCEAADDFVVPASGWNIERVTLSGMYSEGGGPAESVNLRFLRDQAGWPGSTEVCSYIIVGPTLDEAGSLTSGTVEVNLPGSCTLEPGSYWLAAQARMDFAVAGQFFWTKRTNQNTNESVWRNPGDGFGTGHTSWTRMSEDDPAITEDLIFRLAGRSASEVFTEGFECGDCSWWSAVVGLSP